MSAEAVAVVGRRVAPRADLRDGAADERRARRRALDRQTERPVAESSGRAARISDGDERTRRARVRRDRHAREGRREGGLRAEPVVEDERRVFPPKTPRGEERRREETSFFPVPRRPFRANDRLGVDAGDPPEDPPRVRRFARAEPKRHRGVRVVRAVAAAEARDALREERPRRARRRPGDERSLAPGHSRKRRRREERAVREPRDVDEPGRGRARDEGREGGQ